MKERLISFILNHYNDYLTDLERIYLDKLTTKQLKEFIEYLEMLSNDFVGSEERFWKLHEKFMKLFSKIASEENKHLCPKCKSPLVSTTREIDGRTIYIIFCPVCGREMVHEELGGVREGGEGK
ncbi:MAG TPA: hypothetical protein ENG61_02110 [Candidatus Korarchaeota archaeon]|nr:hypothetical protein [Candidatus Korarchaeota archaeon]